MKKIKLDEFLESEIMKFFLATSVPRIMAEKKSV